MPLRRIQKPGLLGRYSIIRTGDPERMRQVLIDVYDAVRFEVLRPAEGFFGQFSRVRLRDIEINYSATDVDVELEISEVPCLRQIICLSGRGEAIFNGVRAQLSRHATCIVPSHTRSEFRLRAGFRMLALRIDIEALHRKFEALIDAPTQEAFEFSAAADFRAPQLRQFRRMLFFLVSELDSSDSATAELPLIEVEQALIVAFLCGHQHNLSHLLRRSPTSASLRQVNLAESYVEANWNKPLTLDAIAEALGISARSLFYAFKKHRGRAPMHFAKEIRFRHAYEMLRNATPDSSVAEVALSCGFQSHGHFAMDYKRRFGELPSETLNRARGPLAEAKLS
jgi:AraC-like DNA-binding protein